MCVCVCVCVCAREMKGGREGREMESKDSSPCKEKARNNAINISNNENELTDQPAIIER